jgi:hypothetical protein
MAVLLVYRRAQAAACAYDATSDQRSCVEVTSTPAVRRYRAAKGEISLTKTGSGIESHAIAIRAARPLAVFLR